MSSHNMAAENWPPGPENTTGVGLWWDSYGMDSLLGHEPQNLDELALVKLSWFQDPANTLLLTEYPLANNRLGHVDDVRVGSPGDQASGLLVGLPKIHYGRFNYLMADGHVELLTGLQTGGIGGSSGIWSIKKGD
jgi:prepilin-type processing-associated H-X9-DG protein